MMCWLVCPPVEADRPTNTSYQHLAQPGRWQLLIVIQVRSIVVVEVDDVTDESLRLIHVLRAFHPVEPFLLDYSVDALGYGVVRGTIVLGHTDGGVYGVEQSYVSVAAVLRAAVGVVDELLQTVASHAVYALLQSRHGVIGYKAVGERPADNLMCVGICEQV